MHPAPSPQASQPIGVFDSGVGGLSVLRQLLRLLPQEDMVYLADTAYAPYGERSQAEIEARSLRIARHLLQQHRIKALVVACNTATAQAAQHLRQSLPDLPLIGIEPAIKPAAALTQTGHIGIMATRGTVQSAKFSQLVADHSQGCKVRIQPCDGLALAIENALEEQSNPDGATVQSLCQRYLCALGPFVSEDAQQGVDTLVLGCTHYPFASDVLHMLAGPGVRLIEPGESVARQTARLLHCAGLLKPSASANGPVTHGRLALLCTASPMRLTRAAQQWMPLPHTQQARLVEIGAQMT